MNGELHIMQNFGYIVIFDDFFECPNQQGVFYISRWPVGLSPALEWIFSLPVLFYLFNYQVRFLCLWVTSLQACSSCVPLQCLTGEVDDKTVQCMEYASVQIIIPSKPAGIIWNSIFYLRNSGNQWCDTDIIVYEYYVQYIHTKI